jgi:hypothetical protein
MNTTYRRIPHAAHYANGSAAVGHDLEEWDVTSDAKPLKSAAGIPADAEWHIGYLDKQGRQHWTFTRVAPITLGPCSRCQPLPVGAVRS